MQAIAVDPSTIRRLTRKEYEQLVASGFFAEDRLELLEGLLVTMSPQKALHAEVVQRLLQALLPALLGRATVRCQSPLALGKFDEPEPDLALVPPGDYSEAHPHDAYLVIEVADTSLRTDRTTKAAVYARAGIGEYWIVNLPDRLVEIHQDPVDGRYRRTETRDVERQLTPAAFPDVILALALILPKRCS